MVSHFYASVPAIYPRTMTRRAGSARICSGATSTPRPTWRCCGLPGSTSFVTSSSRTPWTMDVISSRSWRQTDRDKRWRRDDGRGPAATEAIRQLVPFAAALGVEVVTSSPDEVRARVEWRPERCTTAGVLHGGVIMSLADTTGATCAFQNLPEGAAGTTTIE